MFWCTQRIKLGGAVEPTRRPDCDKNVNFATAEFLLCRHSSSLSFNQSYHEYTADFLTELIYRLINLFGVSFTGLPLKVVFSNQLSQHVK